MKIYNHFKNIPFILSALLCTSLMISCASVPRPTAVVPLPDSGKIKTSSQVLLVTNDSPSSINVTISTLERKNDGWKKVRENFSGVIGRNGFAAVGEKREGDGKTPSGIFYLKTIFGYDPSVNTKMPYRQALPDDIWIDDIHAADYNRWVKKADTRASSFEQMRRDDNLYKYGIIIEYNTDPVIKGHGSAIFFHIWKGENLPTAGCVATAEDNIIKMIEWLDPDSQPLIIMGSEYLMEGLLQ